MDDTTADSTTVERESSLLARENAKLRQSCADLTAQLAALQRELKNGVGASEFAAFREAADLVIIATSTGPASNDSLCQ